MEWVLHPGRHRNRFVLDLHIRTSIPDTWIGVNPWVLSRNTDLYGPDVDVFRPERWLEDTGLNELREKSDIYFGGAYAKCLGMYVPSTSSILVS